jgi:hypothetical protein
MDLSDLMRRLPEASERLATARREIGDPFPWYPYNILANLLHVDSMLTGELRDLSRLAGSQPVADIGAADGDLAFALEQLCGWQVDVIDTPATNMNGLRGAIALRDQLGSHVAIEDVDLDTQFSLPRDRYGLVFFLGILYHLQNPFYVLRQLATRADHLLLSTRVARYAGPDRRPIIDLPVAYLLGPYECNNDATNYWIFSSAGLHQLVDRAGWHVLAHLSVGDVVDSDPASLDHDERMFMLLRSGSAA